MLGLCDDDDRGWLQDYLTDEELEELESEAHRAEDERSIPTPAERNPNLK